jgi:hypothetical protein
MHPITIPNIDGTGEAGEAGEAGAGEAAVETPVLPTEAANVLILELVLSRSVNSDDVI